MEAKNNNTIKASFWYLVSNILLKGLGFITIPIFSRILTKSELGYYNNFTAWLSILTIVATLTLSTSLIRARFEFKDDLGSFVSSNLALGSLSVLLFYLLFSLNRNLVENIFSLKFKYVHIMFLSILFLPAYSMFQQIQRFEYKYKLVVAITLGTTISSVVLSIVLMGIMDDSLDARIIGAQLPLFLVSVVLYIWFFSKSRSIRLQYWRYSLWICVPYLLHLLAGNVLNSVDRIMITNICGAESTALYGMAYNIAMVVSVLWDSLNTAYSPWLGEQLNNKNYKGIREYSYGYVLFFVSCLVGVMLIAPEALFILGGSPYIAAKYVIPPVMLGYLFLFLYSMYVNIEQYEKKTGGMAVATTLAALLNFCLNYIFIPRFGYLAAAYTTLFGYLFLFVFHYVLVKKMNLHNLYDIRFMIIICVMACMVAFLILYAYQSNVIRYGMFLLYILIMSRIVYKNRKMIYRILERNNSAF